MTGDAVQLRTATDASVIASSRLVFMMRYSSSGSRVPPGGRRGGSSRSAAMGGGCRREPRQRMIGRERGLLAESDDAIVLLDHPHVVGGDGRASAVPAFA